MAAKLKCPKTQINMMRKPEHFALYEAMNSDYFSKEENGCCQFWEITNISEIKQEGPWINKEVESFIV